ncbi:hypothetical protein [Kitasatospora sp. NPDC059327]|uniref:hypothetical protein n=1 Tax=Kitasatospora sp. NPDC059327 TaxID=3346803 RepID=UPI0036A4B4A2
MSSPISKEDLRDFRELRDSLAAAGIMTSISQIARAEHDVRRWAAGRRGAVELCQRWGWETTTLRPHYRRVGERLYVMMLADEHTELGCSGVAVASTGGWNGDRPREL